MSTLIAPDQNRATALHRLAEVRRRADALMAELGRQEIGRPLQELGWSFSFDRARRRLGSCQFRRRGVGGKRITASRHFVTQLGLGYRDARGIQVIEDVLRHEIAHAIDFELRQKSDHGRDWKSICARVGADPSRLYEGDNSVRLAGKYVARCPGCGRETHYYRRPARPRACRRCCELHAGGRYDERFELTLRQLY